MTNLLNFLIRKIMKGPIYKTFEKLVNFAFSIEMIFVFIVLACSIYYTLDKDVNNNPTQNEHKSEFRRK